MNRSINLVRILKVLFRAVFLFSTVLGGFSLLMDIFSADKNIGDFRFGTHHSAGYPMPVKVKIEFPDSIVSYNYQGGGGSITYRKGEEVYDYMKELSDSLFAIPNVKKEISTNEARFYPTEKASSLQLAYSHLTTTSYISFKSKNLFITLLMVIHTYLSLILFAACFFQLWRIFTSLEQRFSFHIDIVKRINWLGTLLVFGELAKVTTRLIIQSDWNMIRIFTSTNGKPGYSGIDLSFYPSLDVNWLLILIGLSFFVISALLKIGYNLEQESQFTI